MNAPETQPETLRAWLTAHPEDTAELRLPRLAVEELVAELGRLHQSADRLRKQNKKLRGRIARLKAGEADPGPDEHDEDAVAAD